METRHIKIEKTLTHHVNKRQSSGYKVILGKRGNKKEVNTESKSNSRAYAKYHVSGRKDRRKRREKRLYADRSTIGGKLCFIIRITDYVYIHVCMHVYIYSNN